MQFYFDSSFFTESKIQNLLVGVFSLSTASSLQNLINFRLQVGHSSDNFSELRYLSNEQNRQSIYLSRNQHWTF